MNEHVIARAKQNKQVTFYELFRNRISLLYALPETMEKIVLYCHGLGSNRTWALRFYESLLKNNIGIFAFDFPGHGEDKTDFLEFSLNSCLSYLNEVLEFIKQNYSVPIYLFGSSFGGFVILNRLIEKSDDIKKTMLMCPAVYFYDILNRKANISNDYFETNLYLSLYNDIKIYKDAYLEFQQAEEKIRNTDFHNIAIIQGDCDKTVFYSDIESFCKNNRLSFVLVQNGKHELYGYEDMIIKFLLNEMNEGKVDGV